MVDVAPTTRREPPRRIRRTRRDDAGPTAAPHDLELEESLLGAMLLNEEARTAAFGLCTAGDFYRPAHSLAFSAISSLAARGDPVDVVTVADELSRAGLLEEFGDPHDLVAWQANAPTLVNGAYYAERVAALGAERRLLGASLELANAIRGGDEQAKTRALEAIAVGGGDAARISHQLVREDIGELMRDPAPPFHPEYLARSDGRFLLMPAMVTIIHAEPATGKTWLAIEAVRQVTAAGKVAAVLDYEGNGTTWAQRLLALGATPTDVDRVDYLRPGSVPLHVLVTEAVREEPDLVVIDGLAAALAQSGFDENSNSETLAWLRPVARAIAQHGPAVLVIDHVVKRAEDRGRWGRGAGAKLGETDVAYGLEMVAPYSKEKGGSARLRIAKDRYGAIGAAGELAALMVVTPSDEGNAVTITLDPPPPEGAGWTGPVDAMSAVREVLEETAAGQEFSVNWLVTALRTRGKGFRKQTIATAAERLALDPTVPVVVRTGPRNSRLFRFDPSAVELPYEPVDDEEDF